MPSSKALLFALLLGLIVGFGITTKSLFVSTVAFTAFFYLVMTKTNLSTTLFKNTGEKKTRQSKK